MPNFDDVAKQIVDKWDLIAAVTVIVSSTGIAGIVGLVKWRQNRLMRSRLRQLPRSDFPFDVIKPHSPQGRSDRRL